MTALCELPTPACASAAQELRQRQAAERQAADLEEVAPRDAVAEPSPRLAVQSQHRHPPPRRLLSHPLIERCSPTLNIVMPPSSSFHNMLYAREGEMATHSPRDPTRRIFAHRRRFFAKNFAKRPARGRPMDGSGSTPLQWGCHVEFLSDYGISPIGAECRDRSMTESSDRPLLDLIRRRGRSTSPRWRRPWG